MDMQYLGILLLLAFALLVPEQAAAQDFVPCTGRDCQFCHLVEMGNRILVWLILVLTVVAGLVFAVAGLKLVTSAGNAAAKAAAKSMFTNVIVGFLLVLASWLIVDTMMKMLVNSEEIGPWNRVECVRQDSANLLTTNLPAETLNWSYGQPIPESWNIEFDTPGRVTAAGGGTNAMSDADIEASVRNIQSREEARAMAEQAAREAGLTGRDINTFVALVQQESSMCQNKVGPQTRHGRAYGCSQMLLSTARGLDPNATADRLTNDDAYSLSLGARYYASRLQMYGGDERRALAAYNGGTKANNNSSVCPGQLAWECQRNSGYAETRNYVPSIQRMADEIGRTR